MGEERIGDFLVRIGALTPDQVEDILKNQKRNRIKYLVSLPSSEVISTMKPFMRM
jgi:hypothetical protein